MIEKREIIVLISRRKYSPRSFYFHHKTTACFAKNNGLFYQKQRLVLLKKMIYKIQLIGNKQVTLFVKLNR